MILYADGHPVRRRYSVGFVGSLLFHVALVAVVLSQAGAMRSGDSYPLDARGGSGRRGLHSSAAVGSSQFGGEPTGMMGKMPLAAESSWPVEQAERLGLRLGIGWMIDHLWQSTLFAIVVGLLTLACRRNLARVRYALWFIASVKFLVPLSLVMWLGSPIASSALAVIGTSAPLGAAGAPAGSPGAAGSIGAFGSFGQWLAATGTALWPSTFTIDEVTAAWLALALLGIWTWVFFAIVAIRFRQSQRLWDVALTSRRVELLDVEVPARLQVGLAQDLVAPGVIGWFHPVLLLPADIESHLTRPELEAVVAHELCHVRRFDNMTGAIHMLAEALFWFHPLVWWIGTRLVDERERACDEHVLSTIGAPGPYAQGILNVCKRYVESRLASVSGVGGANVRQRIDAILENRIGEATGPWKKVMLSGIMLCVLIVPMAAGALQGPLPRKTPPRNMPPNFAEFVSVPATTYALVVARANGRLGPELRRVGTAGSDAVDAGAGGAAEARLVSITVLPREISAEAMTLPRLAAVLSSVVGGGVEDRTGLSGDFRIRLRWTSDPNGPSLFDAVQQQLGLQLVKVRPSPESDAASERANGRPQSD
jgi:beta-lactamase regulating signal transducer with metallopeptidase domain